MWLGCLEYVEIQRSPAQEWLSNGSSRSWLVDRCRSIPVATYVANNRLHRAYLFDQTPKRC